MKQRIITLFAGGALALALFGSAMAGPQEDGLNAYQRGDYATAMRLLRPFAEKGNVVAQFDLGVMYASDGQGVKQDNAEAVKWYRKAANQGYAKAQAGLGFMYERGQGVQQDYAEAVKWYRKGAEQGNAIAQFDLGVMYEHGEGVEQDNAEAVKWYRKAAEQGDANAQTALDQLTAAKQPQSSAPALVSPVTPPSTSPTPVENGQHWFLSSPKFPTDCADSPGAPFTPAGMVELERNQGMPCN